MNDSAILVSLEMYQNDAAEKINLFGSTLEDESRLSSESLRLCLRTKAYIVLVLSLPIAVS